MYRHASRFALEFTVGSVPGMWALHTCDTPSCCNPGHLYWGTPQQNVADMQARGRKVQVRGEQHGMARLSADDVAAIRASAASSRELADQYAVSARHVRKIRSGSTW
jgi:hypothetical protein